ncbi:hypothetical protein ACFYWU_41215 [Streptomyces chrestomyceticus]|uniref:hypothetical protein n=1 Tax=Streptomyces chrestomyceticus TaxID=68185 RepID=UPI0036C9C01F
MALRTFDRWMAGDIKQMPRSATCRVLEHLFREPADGLFLDLSAAAAPAAGHLSPLPEALSALAVPTSAVWAPAVPRSAEQFRAGFVSEGSADMASVSPLPADSDDPLTIITRINRLTRSNADGAFLARMEKQLASIVARYEACGPQQLAREARLARQVLHDVLEGQQTPRIRAELFRLASQAAGLLGYMAVNSGADFDLVDAYCTEAETLALEIGDVSVQMWASGTRSLGLYYQKRYADADAAACSGIALAPQNAQAIRLLVNGRSRALARLGDRAGAEQAIGQALELSGRQASLPGGLTSCISFEPYSPARTLANAITARLSLGDTSAVLADARQIQDLIVCSNSPWSQALVSLDVATALLQQKKAPEVEQAMALGRKALRTGSTAPIKSVWQRANELLHSARKWRQQAQVREYAEELRTWRSQPQAEPIVVGSR